jgi:hypothetical protein
LFAVRDLFAPKVRRAAAQQNDTAVRVLDGNEALVVARIIVIDMAMTPAYALAHVFVPNLLKLKGHTAVMSALERRDFLWLDPLWAQAQVEHKPYVSTMRRESSKVIREHDPREAYRIATITLPPPKELGEAYMVGVVINANDPRLVWYFTLEYDYVLAKKANRTMLCERTGQKHSRICEGPVLTGNDEVDCKAFVDCFMELIMSSKVTKA